MRKQATINNFIKRGGTIDPPAPKKVGERQHLNSNAEERDENPAVSKKSSKQYPNISKMIPQIFSQSKSKGEDEDTKALFDLSKTYKLSLSQKKVLDAIMSRHSVFFTGAAGTGKSYVVQILRTVIEALGWENKIAYTAPTGVAACNIRGLTIHAWAGVGKASEPIDQLLPIVLRNSNACKRWREIEILVIDEISMLSSELFDKLDIIGRRVRNNINPFGGLQVIVCGDFFQLPPVGLGKSVKFCFEAAAWKELFEDNREDGMIILDKVFRQKDDTTFLNLLNEMREGSISSTNQQILVQKVQEAQRQQQQQSSTPTDNFASASSLKQTTTKQNKLTVRPTKLFSTNNDVDQYNMTELERLTLLDDENDEKDPRIYFAIDDGKEPFLTQLKAGTKAPSTLHLRKGAQVMLLKNLDTESGLVNGARGTVVDFERSAGRTSFCSMLPVVNFSVIVGTERREERVLLTPETWEIKLGERAVASRQQIPLMLAWAISIHKSQGMTIPWLEVSFNRMFEYGQAYVALSRATSLQGLTLHSFQAHTIRAHPMVKEFYRQIAQRQQAQRHGMMDDILEVSLQSFVDAFMTEHDGKQVDHESWMETKPRPSNSSYQSFVPHFSTNTALETTQEAMHNDDDNVNDADGTSIEFSSAVSTFRSASSMKMNKIDSIPITSSELSTNNHSTNVAVKKPSVLFNSTLSSSKLHTSQHDNGPQFEDASNSNAYGDDWLDADFLSKKRLESNQRIAAMVQQYQQQLSAPTSSSNTAATSITKTISTIVDNATIPFPIANHINSSAPSSMTKNKASSSPISSVTLSAAEKEAQTASCDVVDLVYSSDDEKVILEETSVNSQIIKTELSKQQLQQKFYQSTIREQQSQYNSHAEASANYGGYGISPHLIENGQSLERILSSTSTKSTTFSQPLSAPNTELMPSITGEPPKNTNTTSINSKNAGQIIMTDSLKRKLDENRQKALEKLAMFKKSRLQEPSKNSI